MSRYVTVVTEFRDESALLASLMETGEWTAEQIGVHAKPQHLLGYKGDIRIEKAHIIIRRKHVGSASNDIGFVKGEDGSYKAIISSYDSSKYGTTWVKKLTGNYAFHKLKMEQNRRNRKVTRTRCGTTGKQIVEITGYR